MKFHISQLLLILFLFQSCKEDVNSIRPSLESITESVYASGVVKSKNQYMAFAPVNGIIEKILLQEGDTVRIGTPILVISNETQRLSKENAALSAQLSSLNANQGKINEAKQFTELAFNKMKLDSALYFRQKNLWEAQIGSKAEFEQKELSYQNSKTNYISAFTKYEDLKRQINIASDQTKNNLLISEKLENDFVLKSELNGIVYSILKERGEMIGPQTPLAIVGDRHEFILEMQVDENDIFRIKKGLPIYITMDSYKGNVFEAVITKINPIMNERSKSFVVEAEFTKSPQKLFPNVSFEGNIVLQKKDKALLIPRNYLKNDSIVLLANGDEVVVKTGLKDYRKVEIISGIKESDEIIKPTE